MEDEAYLDPAGTRCLIIVRLIALYGIRDGPAIGDAIVKRERGDDGQRKGGGGNFS